MVDVPPPAAWRHAALSRVGLDESGSTRSNEDPAVDAALERIFSSRWRRSAVSPASYADTRAKVERAFSMGTPVSFSIPFGGYKSWHEPSAPLPDWSEVFALSYLRRYFESVARVVPGGIDVAFSYCSGVMDRVSNMPLEWQRAYMAAFTRLLRRYSDALVQFSAFDVIRAYASPAAALEELLDKFDRFSADWTSSIPQAEQEKRLASAARNLVLDGVDNLVSLSPSALAARVRSSAIMCDALDSLTERRGFNKFGSRIQVVFIRGPQPAVHLGTCETSAYHFWVGSGVLELRGERILPRIVAARRLPTDAVIDLATPEAASALDLPALAFIRGYITTPSIG